PATDTATLYTLPLHDALPISDDKAAEAAMSIGEKARAPMMRGRERDPERTELDRLPFIEFVHDIETEPVHQTPDPDRNDNRLIGDRKSTRLNSSHEWISYAVF